MQTLFKHILRFQLPLLSFNVLRDFFSNQSHSIRLLQTRSPYLLCLDEVLNSTERNVSSLTRFRWHYMRGLQDRLGVGHPLNQHQPRVQELGNLLWGKKSRKQMNIVLKFYFSWELINNKT